MYPNSRQGARLAQIVGVKGLMDPTQPRSTDTCTTATALDSRTSRSTTGDYRGAAYCVS